jgi:glycerophosphoryl diester phosphodiesterase
MTLAIAHRGDPIGAVENTVAAVQRALDLGADAVEVDVRVTLDGTVVLHHDTDLQRVWKHPGVIARLPLADLRRHAPQIPTLDEALAAVEGRGAPLVLDVGDAAVAVAAHEAAQRAGALGRVWFCGDPTALAAVRARDESITLMLTWEKVTPPGQRTLEATRPTYFNPYHRLLSRSSVRAWQGQGVKVCAWTVDDPGRLARLTEWGIDAMISNNVAAAVASVAGSGPQYAGR